MKNKCFLCGDEIINRRMAYYNNERYSHIIYCTSECYMIAQDHFKDEEFRNAPIPSAPELLPVPTTHAKIKRSIRNKSGVRGISWCKQRKKWRVSLQVNKKRIKSEYSKHLTRAVEIRKEMEIKYNAIH